MTSIWKQCAVNLAFNFVFEGEEGSIKGMHPSVTFMLHHHISQITKLREFFHLFKILVRINFCTLFQIKILAMSLFIVLCSGRTRKL